MAVPVGLRIDFNLFLPQLAPLARAVPAPWDDGCRMYGSGRHALRALLRFGRRERDWRRLLVPSYVSPSLVAAAEQELPVDSYVDRPTLESPSQRVGTMVPGDVVLVVDYFGIRGREWEIVAPDGVDVIEDHSYDPWSSWCTWSRAEYCIASLHKTLPLPDGGVVWSPRDSRLPPAPPEAPSHTSAALRKLAAMQLDQMHQSGHDLPRDVIRRLRAQANKEIARGEISGMTSVSHALLRVLPTDEWRTRRRENFRCAAELLAGFPELELLGPLGEDAVPFALVLCCESTDVREKLRVQLLESEIYPEIAWSLERASSMTRADDLRLSRRILTLPCDYRFQPGDMDRLAFALARALSD